MQVLVMGCGRVGSTLAADVAGRGHDVVVIDRSPAAFLRLGPDFPGRTIAGNGFDRSVLVDAGIESADAFAAVSSGDNSNIIAARVAKETFRVPRVMARIYDPGRAEVFERLGITTVATVPWAVRSLVRRVLGHAGPADWVDPTGSVSLVTVQVPDAWAGSPVADFAAELRAAPVALTRYGDCAIPDGRKLLQAGDVLHLSVSSDHVDEIDDLVTEGPSDE